MKNKEDSVFHAVSDKTKKTKIKKNGFKRRNEVFYTKTSVKKTFDSVKAVGGEWP